METVEDQSKICGICKENTGKYVCPRCNVVYCSLPCYRANEHLKCSESFYKECIEEELKNKDSDPQAQEEVLRMLQRIENEEDEESLDSDDEDMVPELSERLTGVDLDDADAVWEALSEEEKREFTDLLQKGDVSQIVPPWAPWWRNREEKKLVEELDVTQENKESFIEDSPSLLENIPEFDQICKKPPSPCVQFNLFNVLYAYAYVAQYFAGDHLSFAMEAVNALLMLSGNLRSGSNYETAESAVESAALEASNCQWLSGSKELKNSIKSDVRCIIEGPNETNRSHYLLAALSDLYRCVEKAKSETGKVTKKKGSFTKKFNDDSLFSLPPVAKTQLKAVMKKIEFYMSWSKTYAAEAFTL